MEELQCKLHWVREVKESKEEREGEREREREEREREGERETDRQTDKDTVLACVRACVRARTYVGLHIRINLHVNRWSRPCITYHDTHTQHKQTPLTHAAPSSIITGLPWPEGRRWSGRAARVPRPSRAPGHSAGGVPGAQGRQGSPGTPGAGRAAGQTRCKRRAGRGHSRWDGCMLLTGLYAKRCIVECYIAGVFCLASWWDVET